MPRLRTCGLDVELITHPQRTAQERHLASKSPMGRVTAGLALGTSDTDVFVAVSATEARLLRWAESTHYHLLLDADALAAVDEARNRLDRSGSRSADQLRVATRPGLLEPYACIYAPYTTIFPELTVRAIAAAELDTGRPPGTLSLFARREDGTILSPTDAA